MYAFWLHFAQGWYVVQSKEAAKTLSWLVMNAKHDSASFIVWATMIETSAAVLTVPLALGVGGLLGWHLYITSKVHLCTSTPFRNCSSLGAADHRVPLCMLASCIPLFAIRNGLCCRI